MPLALISLLLIFSSLGRNMPSNLSVKQRFRYLKTNKEIEDLADHYEVFEWGTLSIKDFLHHGAKGRANATLRWGSEAEVNSFSLLQVCWGGQQRGSASFKLNLHLFPALLRRAKSLNWSASCHYLRQGSSCLLCPAWFGKTFILLVSGANLVCPPYLLLFIEPLVAAIIGKADCILKMPLSFSLCVKCRIMKTFFPP